ncbi:hypothetical protein CANARDRAFT_175077 [[Candida] arabinofermentans NRRL YB-2248]|uniref:NAD-dependent epimerase/dehydratase domain-containing protein n=1 Tax=[Candida] arabinofermentans NRRL YB-2248 TaxID=983967 RepID=A0A1E4T306_9ASCO|nr:hypothetical protein CANARDRAFT_175077 [[Candida] arabinofermentans NRRL YB-2248]
MSSTNKTTIFITGANGYIAKHIIKQALEAGYGVVGTVRSTEKGDALAKLVKNSKFSYEVVKSLDHKGVYDQPLKNHPEVTVLLHTASPVDFSAKDPLNETIIPAIEGVKELFDSVKANAPQIKRVVLTTSIAAIAIAVLKGINAVGGPYTESDWSPITIEEGSEDGYKAYCASKKFEELAAWKYVEEEKPNFTLATVAPAYAIGPQAFEEDAAAGIQASTSSSIAGLLKLGKSDEIPVFVGDMVDVRDVAKCHILAFELDSAQGERFIAASECFSNHQAIEVITKVFPQYKDLLPTPDLDEREKPTAPIFQNERTRKILGFEFIKPEVSIVDQLNQLFKYK